MNCQISSPQPGGGEVRIGARKAGNYVLVEIEDTGPGIPRSIFTKHLHACSVFYFPRCVQAVETSQHRSMLPDRLSAWLHDYRSVALSS
jgi:hypothetical protein